MLNLRIPVAKDIWRHFKDPDGNELYFIVGCGLDVDTGNIEVCYCYNKEKDNKFRTLFHRNLSEFLGYTETKQPRFTYLHTLV